MARQTITIQPSDSPRLLHIDTTYELEDAPVSEPNQSPVVNAGQNQVITLPKSEVVLQGNATDPDGTIAEVVWTKQSGPGCFILDPNSINTKVTGLIAGVYVFNLAVTDNDGSRSYAETTITVKEAPVQEITGYELTYQNGYDKLSDLSPNQIGIKDQSAVTRELPKYLDLVIANNSPGSFKSIVPSGGNNVSSGQRSEQQYNDEKQNPAEGMFEYEVMYRHGALSGDGSSVQWHPNNSGSSLVGLHTTKGRFQVFRSIDLAAGNVRNAVNYYQTGALKAIEQNRWYRMRWLIKWSTGNDGYVKLYIDGELYYTFTGRTQDSDGKPYFKLGVNRWNNLSGETIVNYDNLRIYKKV